MFVNESQVLWAARDLNLADSAAGVEVSFKTPVFEVGRSPKQRRAFTATDPRDLASLVEALRDSGQLSGLRPDDERHRSFVHEIARAAPMSIPGEHGADGIHVWLVGPSEVDKSPALPVVLLEQDMGHSASSATLFLRRFAESRFHDGAGAVLRGGSKHPVSRAILSARRLGRSVGRSAITASRFVRRLGAGPARPRDEPGPGLDQLVGLDRESGSAEWGQYSKLLELFDRRGAEVERPRQVMTLYQVVRQSTLGDGAPCLLAYALFIAEMPWDAQ